MKTDINSVLEFQKKKNSETLRKIILENMNLVNKISSYFHKRNSNLSIDDIKSCGIEGLIKSIYKYNSEKNDNFEWYASTWIKACIKKYIMNNVTPFSITTRDGRKSFSSYYKEDKDSISHHYMNNAINSNISFEDKYMSSSLNPEETMQQKQFFNIINEKIEKIKTNLSMVEQYILDNRILAEEPKTLKEISEKYNFSNQAICYKEKKIRTKLKKEIRELIENDAIPLLNN